MTGDKTRAIVTGAGGVPPLFAAFDRVRIINLAYRADRREEMKGELAKVGLLGDERVAFFPAVACDDPGIFQSRGAHGCFLSHIGVLKEAAASGASVILLEDDCDFRPEIFAYELPEGVDIFCGGYLEASDPDDLYASDIIGAHFMGFSARAAKIAVAYFADYVRPDFACDPKAMRDPGYDPAIRPPVDGGYVWLRRAHPELVTEFAMISMQRASRTDIGALRFYDRWPVLRQVAQLLRKARRAVKRSD